MSVVDIDELWIEEGFESGVVRSERFIPGFRRQSITRDEMLPIVVQTLLGAIVNTHEDLPQGAVILLSDLVTIATLARRHYGEADLGTEDVATMIPQLKGFLNSVFHR